MVQYPSKGFQEMTAGFVKLSFYTHWGGKFDEAVARGLLRIAS